MAANPRVNHSRGELLLLLGCVRLLPRWRERRASNFFEMVHDVLLFPDRQRGVENGVDGEMRFSPAQPRGRVIQTAED